jgi:hypothetical protein
MCVGILLRRFNVIWGPEPRKGFLVWENVEPVRTPDRDINLADRFGY